MWFANGVVGPTAAADRMATRLGLQTMMLSKLDELGVEVAEQRDRTRHAVGEGQIVVQREIDQQVFYKEIL